MAQPAQLTPQQAAMQAANANFTARQLVLQNGVRMRQQLPPQSVVPTTQNILQFQPNNVGLITGFLVKIQGTIRNTNAANAITRTQFGASNLVSQFQFTDLWNNVRVNTTGWHLGILNSAKHPLVFGGAYSPNVPVNYGNNWTVQSAAAGPVAKDTDIPVQFYWYVPLAYSKTDLRGAIYSSVLNAQQILSITINPTPVALAGADATLAVYSNGDAAGGWKAATNVTVTVWQDYIDQLPRDQAGQVILPPLDIQQAYMLNNTAMPNPVVNQDYNIPFANYREFYSVTVVYDNAGVLNTGSDINYFAHRAANNTQFWQLGPNECALMARQVFAADPPNGCYYFDYRDKPVNTIVFGNQNIVINPSVVTGSTSVLLLGWEAMANITQMSYTAALPTGG